MGPPSHIPPFSPLPPHDHHRSYTLRPYTSYCSRCLSPATLPAEHSCALIVTPGHVGGNDLPWQRQRQLPQHLRQWNYGSLRSTVMGEISFGVFLPGFCLVFFPVQFRYLQYTRSTLENLMEGWNKPLPIGQSMGELHGSLGWKVTWVAQ